MLPLIKLSLIIPCARQDESHLQALLASIDQQDFPKESLEVLIMRQGNSEEAKAFGIQKAQGDILGLLCADNQLLGEGFLTTMYQAASHPQVIGAYPRCYAYLPSDTALSRYFALLGANDPLCWWLGKSDRDSVLVERPPGTRHVDFRTQIPSIGDNGFFVKAAAIKFFVTDPQQHFCIDVCEDMRRAGLSTYAITDNVLWHKTGQSFPVWLKKRGRYVHELYWQVYAKRRWRMVSSREDWIRTAAFALASLVLVPHLWVVLRGMRRVRDPAWLLHPLVCLCLTLLYTWAMIQHTWRQWCSRRWIDPKNWRLAFRA